MTTMPELVKEQQIALLLQSCGLGAFLGLLFEVFSVPIRLCRRRRFTVFSLDVAFLVVCSLITFYFSLATMDGRLHPLLFVGCLFGFGLQHITVGRFIGLWLYRIVRFVRLVFTWLFRILLLPLLRLREWLRRFFRSFALRVAKKERKTRKKARFFRKNS